MTNQTALYEQHLKAGAKMVDFAGWDMPIHYGSQKDEHHIVRQAAGMFDVSHMVVVDLKGAEVRAFLQALFANDVAKLKTPGKALYSCMLNETGGVIDDLITYYINDEFYRVVVNAGTRDKDLAWMGKQIESFDASLRVRDDLSMVAVQGPAARQAVMSLLNDDEKVQAEALKPFFGGEIGGMFIARTGYTGEDGFEVMIDNDSVATFWDGLLAAGVKPIGLGARDTLRLEAGMNLYGSDMDESISPLEAGLAWTVAWEPADRKFIGREAIEAKRGNKENQRFVGLLLEGRGVLRAHQKVVLEDGSEGEITSGSYSPTLERSVAMARVPASIGGHCEVEIRGKRLPVKVVKMPFVRHGKAQIEL